MLNKGDYFTTFDLTSGYHHIEIHPEHRKFLGFQWTFENGSSRYFEFCVLPFGLALACYIFTKVLRPFTKRWRGVVLKPLFILTTVLQHFKVLKSLNPLVNLLEMNFFLLGL